MKHIYPIANKERANETTVVAVSENPEAGVMILAQTSHGKSQWIQVASPYIGYNRCDEKTFEYISEAIEWLANKDFYNPAVVYKDVSTKDLASILNKFYSENKRRPDGKNQFSGRYRSHQGCYRSKT